MKKSHVVIIGGGLAGLAAGSYAQASGFRTTILEHNLALGGVCTSWRREPYTIDGCIHWLTGGPFERLYRELGIMPKVETRTIQTFTTYRHVRSGLTIPIGRDFLTLRRALEAIAPDDRAEIARLLAAAEGFADLDPSFDKPQELKHFGDMLKAAWEVRRNVADFVHFRKTFKEYADENLKTPVLRAVLRSLAGDELPMMAVVFILGYLHRGYLSRPVGGTTAFRDAAIQTYRDRGGEVRLHTTADEILVRNDRACGVRLADGTQLDADVVISTASSPETVFRLLGGRYDAALLQKRLDTWKLIEPIVLATFGVARPLSELPSTLFLDGITPFDAGGRQVDRLYLRIFNDEPSVAPRGHTLVQTMLPASYDHWATRGDRYHTEKQLVAQRVLDTIEAHVPGVRDAVRMTDVSTPLTYWSTARSWRGAYEGWMPNGDSFFGGVDKRLHGLSGLYMAGQWVEPGGGVPTAIMSGRQAVQLLCADEGREFAQALPYPD